MQYLKHAESCRQRSVSTAADRIVDTTEWLNGRRFSTEAEMDHWQSLVSLQCRPCTSKTDPSKGTVQIFSHPCWVYKMDM